jgi:hypothetical protein
VAGGDDEKVAASPAARSTEGAILVPVPEAEPIVARLRDRDRAARWGVPAHVTGGLLVLPGKGWRTGVMIAAIGGTCCSPRRQMSPWPMRRSEPG